MRQRVALIRTLAIDPDILLLDEPFSALDYQTRLALSDDVYGIIKKEGKTAIMISHDIGESVSMADRIVVLTKRPCVIKNIYDINIENKSTPIENRKLDNREILELFDLLNEFNGFYVTKINCKKLGKDGISIYKGNVRAGQIKSFNKSLILVGVINKGGKVIVNGDLYILGKVNGEVEIKSKESKIYCEVMKESLVKIGDIYKYYSDTLLSKEIYLEDNSIKERDYKKGEILNGKSNSCYIG